MSWKQCNLSISHHHSSVTGKSSRSDLGAYVSVRNLHRHGIDGVHVTDDRANVKHRVVGSVVECVGSGNAYLSTSVSEAALRTIT